MNFGQRGRDLLIDLKKSDWLPQHSPNAVRDILQEIHWHCEELENQMAIYREEDGEGGDDNDDDNTNKKRVPEEAKPSLVLHGESIRRNKRCLLAYYNHRLNKIKDFQHEQSTITPGVKALLSESELNFLTEYDKLRANFGEGVSLNLSSNVMPPEHDLIQIRVLEDLGTIISERGASVHLGKGTIHFLPRADVELWIRQGSVAQLNGEEVF